MMNSHNGCVSKKERHDERPFSHRPRYCSGNPRPHLQPRPQGDRTAILLFVSGGRIGWRCAIRVDAIPPGLARYTPSLLRRNQARTIFGDAHYAWHIDDLLRADDGAPGSIWKLFSAVADRRAGNGFPAAEHAVVLVHPFGFSCAALRILRDRRGPDLRMDTLSSAERGAQRGARPGSGYGFVDRKHRIVLLRIGARLHQFHRYGARPARA